MTTPTQPLASASLNANLNARERKAQRLLAHYATCERLARYLALQNTKKVNGFPHCCFCGSWIEKCKCPAPDGKKISVALLKAERRAQKHAERICNEADYLIHDQNAEQFKIQEMVRQALGTLPPGFFVNSDPRGHALKIDNGNPEGQLLIATVGLHRDMGGYGILSPEINGDR